jgi:hypothetical protein
MFAYNWRTDTQIYTKLSVLIPWNQGDILERPELRKIVLRSSPGEGGSCKSETKHDRRTVPRPELNTGYNPDKLPWVRAPFKMVSVVRKQSTIVEQQEAHLKRR